MSYWRIASWPVEAPQCLLYAIVADVDEILDLKVSPYTG
jgi:hypothetical protein